MAARMHDTTAVVPPSKRVCHPPYRSVPTQGYSSRRELPWWQRITRTGSLAMSFPDTLTLRQTGSAENISGHALTYRGIRSMKHRNAQQDGMRRSSSLHDLPTTSRPDDDAAFVALGRNFRSRSRESLVGGSVGYLPPAPSAAAPLHAPQPQRPVSVCCFADSVVCNANSTDSTAACVVVCDRPHKPRTLFEALADPDPPTPKAKHDHYVELASVPKLRPVDRYAGEVPTPTGESKRPGRVTKLNGLTLTNTVANKARFWEAQSKGAGTVAPTGGRTVRNAPTKAVMVAVSRREHSPPRSPPTSKTSPLLHAPRLAPAPIPASAPLTFTTSLHSVGQDSSAFSSHGRTSAMAGPPAPLSLSRSWRSSERSPSPPPVWNSADPLWQSQPRSPTSSLLLNGRSKNETDEYKVSAPCRSVVMETESSDDVRYCYWCMSCCITCI